MSPRAPLNLQELARLAPPAPDSAALERTIARAREAFLEKGGMPSAAAGRWRFPLLAKAAGGMVAAGLALVLVLPALERPAQFGPAPTRPAPPSLPEGGPPEAEAARPEPLARTEVAREDAPGPRNAEAQLSAPQSGEVQARRLPPTELRAFDSRPDAARRTEPSAPLTPEPVPGTAPISGPVAALPPTQAPVAPPAMRSMARASDSAMPTLQSGVAGSATPNAVPRMGQQPRPEAGPGVSGATGIIPTARIGGSQIDALLIDGLGFTLGPEGLMLRRPEGLLRIETAAAPRPDAAALPRPDLLLLGRGGQWEALRRSANGFQPDPALTSRLQSGPGAVLSRGEALARIADQIAD